MMTKKPRRSWREDSTASDFRFSLLRGTATFFAEHKVPTEIVKKVQDGSPHIGDQIRAGEIAMVINTPEDAHSQADSYRDSTLCRSTFKFLISLRWLAPKRPLKASSLLKQSDFEVKALQDYAMPEFS